MHYLYGELNILRALDEAEFWKHQESEHTDLIPAITPGLEPQYLHRLEQFGRDLRRMEAEAVKYIASVTRSGGHVSGPLRAQMLGFINSCVEQSKAFVGLMNEMLQNSHAVQTNQVSQNVIHHMIRESMYFIGIDQLMLQ